MSFFPQIYVNAHESGLAPLFRILNEVESASRGSSYARHGHRGRYQRHFNPRFDVIETETAYELHGELGGVAKENVSVEFPDDKTVTISGKSDRTNTAGTPPAGLTEKTSETTTIAEDAAAEDNTSTAANSHQATVEDDKEDDAVMVEAETPATTTAEPEKAANEPTEKPVAAERNKECPKYKYWVSERSVGSFSRTFTFPHRVDPEAVTASLKDGILKLTVPKAKKPEARRIVVA